MSGLAVILMWAIAFLLVSSCLGDDDIEYRLWYNYDVEVYDWNGNGAHGQKPAIGTGTAVNTPYGLYLSGKTVVLPPNSESSSKVMQDYKNFSVRLIMRYVPGVSGSVPREIISLQKGSNIRLQLRQQSANVGSSPTFELEYRVGGTTYTTPVSGSYALSKWYYFQISVNRHIDLLTTDIDLCVNDSVKLSVSRGMFLDYDWDTNTLGGSGTKGIYYWFYYDHQMADYCNGSSSGSTSHFVTSASGSPCSYVCPSSDYHICNTDGVTLDYDCSNCSTSCGNYGCVQNSPLTCWTKSCPPSGRNNADCSGCYAHSWDNHASSEAHAPECKCASNYYMSAQYPLTCLCKL
jgi:hypothetical protein